MDKSHLLRLLGSASAGYVSGADLAAALGVSRTAVWKQIRLLERDGYRIEAVPSKGYRLTSVPDRIDIGRLRTGLATAVVGREISYVESSVSTNTLAMGMATDGAPDGTVVIAETQTGGKGRLGRTWASPRGNLFLSVILRPSLPTHRAPIITLMGAVAVAAAIRTYTGLNAGIKWPNDILIGGRKAGGLLTEMSAEQDRIRHVVLGIGVNVNLDRAELPDGVAETATSLAAEQGGTLDRTTLLRAVLEELDRWYACLLGDETAVLEAWKALNVTLGRAIAVSGQDGTFTGIATDIDTEGRLLVLLTDGTTRTVAAGDVTILKR